MMFIVFNEQFHETIDFIQTIPTQSERGCMFFVDTNQKRYVNISSWFPSISC